MKRGEVIDYWTGIGPEGWYNGGPKMDADITRRFMDSWENADSLHHWTHDATGTLAFLILTDQFPRNMFREDARAFATDRMALDVAYRAVRLKWDLRFDGPIRQFFYLPFMHSELRADHETCVSLFLTRMPGTDNLLHARAHRDIIRRFGRFPYRNAVLGRENTPAEDAFLAAGGYAQALKSVA